MEEMEIPIREKSIIFIGFMGVGKTTIGRLVAKKLYRDFVDIDEEIEKFFDMPVKDIFATYGEKTFRNKEKELVLKFCNKRLQVISLGGGAFLQKEIKEACLKNGIVIFLDLSWESWKDRIHLLIDSRPVLQGKSWEELEKLYYERQQIYKEHHSKINTDDLDVEEAANFIADAIKLTWELHD